MNSIQFLVAAGDYKLAKIKDTDGIVITDEHGHSTEYCATSVRITIIGREKAGGPLGDKYGIVCAENDRKKTLYTLAGGRVEPSVNLNREGEEPAEESVLECLKREVLEELRINIDPTDSIEKGGIPEGLLLTGVRIITEINSSEPQKIGDRICVDACFLMVIDERLGYSEGFRGETGTRSVLPPQKLFAQPKNGEMRILPQPQELALAMSIIFVDEIFSIEERPAALQQIIENGLEEARNVRLNSRWSRNFIPTIQC